MKETEKTEGQKKQEALSYKKKNYFETATDAERKEMFAYADTVLEFSGEAPAPDPIGIAEVGESFKNCAYKAFYGQISTEEAAANFRKEADEILARNN